MAPGLLALPGAMVPEKWQRGAAGSGATQGRQQQDLAAPLPHRITMARGHI